MDESRIAEMLERHYRAEAGCCARCGCVLDEDDGAWLAEWPCDAAVLLKSMGHTLREDPPYVYVPPPFNPMPEPFSKRIGR